MPSHSVKHLQDCRGRFAPQPSYYKDVSKYCGNIVNLMKHNLTTAQLIDWCRKIVEHNQEDR